MREYSLLMVDDELFAVRGITEGISWEEFGITKVYGVCNVKEAKTILERERIDVVISDIEMPGENGLDLLTWVSENCPGTKMLLLTAYARFDYAAYALRYQAEDYLLKPVVHEELKQRVKQCLEKIQEEEQTEEELESLRLTVPLLVEKFWTDILEGRKVAYSRQIKELRKYVMLPIFAEERVTPILMAADTEAGMMEAALHGSVQQKCAAAADTAGTDRGIWKDDRDRLGGNAAVFCLQGVFRRRCAAAGRKDPKDHGSSAIFISDVYRQSRFAS